MRIQLVPNTANPRACAATRALAADLAAEGHAVTATVPDAIGCSAEVAAGAASEAELVVALGGDGTILKATHLLAGADVPIFGINLGRLGFLCGASGDDPLGAVRAVVAGEAREVRRVMLRAEATHGGRVAGSHYALNEVFVGRSTGARAVEIAVAVDGEVLVQWLCDGLIVATPTGSTAHSLSVGGPIVAPELRAMVLVPVGAHTLAARPLVLGPSSCLTLTFPVPARADVCMLVDGDPVASRSAPERIEVALAAEEIRTLHVDGRSFIATARDSFFRG
jgi:NAD+ kinase